MPFRARPNESAHFTHGLTVVLLAAFMLRALIPTGWMPQASTSGDGVTLVICTVAGLQEITLGPDGHPQPTGDEGQASAGHDPCPFAAVTKFTPPALTALLVLPTDYGAVEPLRHTPEAPAATHLRLAESRAPPVHI
jgi:hypothetical protein